MKHALLKYCALFLCVILLCSGCSIPDVSTLFMSADERREYFHDSPLFWNHAIAVEGSDALYELQNDFFLGKPYNNILNFGENILLIGEASYGSLLEGSFLNRSEETYEYSFEVYSPWYNRITASLSHNEVSCTSYQVCGDRLFLLNAEDGQLNVYNTSLKQTGSYDLSFFEDLDSITFYASGKEDLFYLSDAESANMECIRFTEGSVSRSPVDLPYYDLSVLYESPSECTITLLGVNENTLQDVIVVFDTVSATILEEYPAGDLADIVSDAYVSFLPTGNMMLRNCVLDSTSSHYICSFSYYEKNGTGISSISYDCGDYSMTSDFVYLARDFAVKADDALCFLLVYNSDCQPYLLVWDLSQSASDMEALEVASNASGKDDGAEWGALSDIRARADALEQLYGIEIAFGQELPESIGIYQLDDEIDANTLSECLDVLSESLTCYPVNFFPQLCMGEHTDIVIYLSKSIYSDSEGMLEAPTGFIDSVDNRLVMVLNAQYCWDWEYTINHEISHMIDRRLEYRSNYVPDALFSEKKWSSFNPDGCEYLNSYENYENSEMYELYSDYFADAYGLTFATEDRAELFGLAMSDYLGYFDEDDFFKPDTPTAEKYKYYCACIRDGFDTTGWEDVMPWEKIIQKTLQD